MHTRTQSLQQALSRHRTDGRYSLGTAAIVESLHTDYKLSYEQIADIAKVSIAGLGRWRKLDKGEHKTFAPLLGYAEKLLGGEAGKADAAPVRPEASPVDVRPVGPLSIAEAKQGLSLKFGVDPDMIEILIKG